MRHRKKGTRLGRTTAHVKALKSSLVRSLIEHGRIITTIEKAKEAKPLAEKLVTLAKKGELHHRRQAFQVLQDKAAVHKLFEEVGKNYADRQGGYTRILKLARRRLGDNGSQAILELV